MKIISKLAKIIENHGKRKALRQLRLMTNRQLIDCGYSPELLSEGVKAWPWREIPENFSPLRFDQPSIPSSAPAENEPSDKTPEKGILVQQDAA